jgi:hypothetical protein
MNIRGGRNRTRLGTAMTEFGGEDDLQIEFDDAGVVNRLHHSIPIESFEFVCYHSLQP